MFSRPPSLFTKLPDEGPLLETSKILSYFSGRSKPNLLRRYSVSCRYLRHYCWPRFPRVNNAWITFSSCELSFLVPWPSRKQIKKKLPKHFKKFKYIRIIIDCCEFYIQKPTIRESQKSTWSSYKSYNTVKLLVGITPTGVISFIPHPWTGSIFDTEIVKKQAAYLIKKLLLYASSRQVRSKQSGYARSRPTRLTQIGNECAF